MSRWLLVELDPDLEARRTTLRGVFAALSTVAGVVTVADVAAVSRETLDQWLLPAQPLPQKRRNGRKAS